MNLREWYNEYHNTKVKEHTFTSLYDIIDKPSIKDFKLSSDTCATNIIRNLFSQYVDSETLIVTTNFEHFKVNEILKNYKNVFYINEYLLLNLDILEKKLQNLIPKYKRFFVYIIGVQMNTGMITPQIVIQKLFQVLPRESTFFTLDDVHGLFMDSRDYSIFDFVIGTTHALIQNLDCGLLFHRTNYDEDKHTVDRVLPTVLDWYTKIETFLKFGDIIQKEFTNKPLKYKHCNYVKHILAYKLSKQHTNDFLYDFMYQGINHTNLDEALKIEDREDIKILRLRAQNWIELTNEEFDIAYKALKRILYLYKTEED